MRGCLTLVLGFVLGAGLMLYWWPRPPRGITAPAPADLRVMISDTYLSRAVGNRLSSLTAPQVTNLRISSVPPNYLVAAATLTAGPLAAPASVQIQPVAANGQIEITIIASSLAGVPIPSQLIGVVQDSINARTRRLLGAHTSVVGARVLPSGLEVDANYR